MGGGEGGESTSREVLTQRDELKVPLLRSLGGGPKLFSCDRGREKSNSAWGNLRVLWAEKG